VAEYLEASEAEARAAADVRPEGDRERSWFSFEVAVT
jgi:hypothetical protein